MNVFARSAAAALAVAALALLFAAPASAKKAASVDYIYVVDTSSSMSGNGGDNIWQQVRDSITTHIDTVTDGSTVLVMPFHAGVQSQRKFTISGDQDRAAAKQYVDKLKANGGKTWIASSLEDAFGEAESLAGASGHTQIVLLFTDGKEEERGAKFTDVIKRFNLARQNNTNLFLTYIAPESKVDDSVESGIENTAGMSLVSFSGVPTFSSAGLSTTELDFGNPTAAPQTRVVKALIPKDNPAQMEASVEFADDALKGVIGEVTVGGAAEFSLAESMKMTLKLENVEALADRPAQQYAGTITLSPVAEDQSHPIILSPAVIDFTVTIGKQPTVSIVPAPGGHPSGELGALRRTRTTISGASQQWNVVWEGVQAGAKSAIHVEVVEGADNPGALQDGLTLTSGDKSGRALDLDASDSVLVLNVTPNAKSALRGDYSFTIVVTPTAANVAATEQLVASEEAPGSYEIQTTCRIPSRPMSPLSLAAIVLGLLLSVLAIAFAVFCLLTGQGIGRGANDLLHRAGLVKTVFEDESLRVREPVDAVQTMSIAGLNTVTIGSGGTYLADANASIQVVAVWEHGRLAAHVKSTDGMPRYRSGGMGPEGLFDKEPLTHGDTIRVGKYVVQFESGSII